MIMMIITTRRIVVVYQRVAGTVAATTKFCNAFALFSTTSTTKIKTMVDTRMTHLRSSVFMNRGDRCHSGSESELESSPTTETKTTNLLSIEECLEMYYNYDNNNNNNNTSTTQHRLQFIDATWYHKGTKNGRNEFELGPRMPNSVHWDISDMSTTSTTDCTSSANPKQLKNIFPPLWLVGAALEQIGIINNNNNNNNNDDDDNNKTESSATTTTTMLVIYGRKGTLFAPRVWYTIKKYYCENITTTNNKKKTFEVKLLQGSIEEWIAKGGPVEYNPLPKVLSSLDTSTTSTTYDNDDDEDSNLSSSSISTSSSSSSINVRTSFVLRAKNLVNSELDHRLREHEQKEDEKMNQQHQKETISVGDCYKNKNNRLVDMQFVLDYLEHTTNTYTSNNKNQDQQHDNYDQDGEREQQQKQEEIICWPSVIIDTRGSSFAKKGHIPGAIHIPYSSLSQLEDPLRLKSKTELVQIIYDAFVMNGIMNTIDDDNNDNDENNNDDSDDNSLVLLSSLEEFFRQRGPPLLTCGTGVSVCTLALVLQELFGSSNTTSSGVWPAEPYIYDGSWNEWGKDPTTPKAGI